MTYFKLIHGGEIVDAIIGDSANWLVENPRSLSIYTGKEAQARGVLSTDGQTVWHIEGRQPFTDYPAFKTAQLVEIDAQEYADLIAALEDGETVPEPIKPEPEPAPEPEPVPEKPMNMSEMRKRITELEAALNIIMGMVE